jgi:Protein of unknown function (DUF3558)
MQKITFVARLTLPIGSEDLELNLHHRLLTAMIASLFLLAGCRGSATSNTPQQDPPNKSSISQTQRPLSAQHASLDRCALLTDNEVQEAIGAHRPGSSDLNNEWGLQSCRWTATTAQKVDAYPDGWFDAVEVAVFDDLRVSWAQEQAKGEPVNGFVEGALFDDSYGDLWFTCARNRFCVVKVRTASGDKRAQHARHLSQLVENRLQ